MTVAAVPKLAAKTGCWLRCENERPKTSANVPPGGVSPRPPLIKNLHYIAFGQDLSLYHKISPTDVIFLAALRVPCTVREKREKKENKSFCVTNFCKEGNKNSTPAMWETNVGINIRRLAPTLRYTIS